MPRRRVTSSVTLPPFQQLLDCHARDVHRFLVATVGRTDADDCYQETWLAALRAYPRLRDASNLRSWIFTVAHRKAIDHIRARGRRAVPVSDVPEPTAAAATTTAAGASGGAGEAPAGALTGPQAAPELWQLVRDLPDKQRTAVALRYVADAPYAEISAVMGTSEDAARRNVHEGLKRLRTEYQP
jgi:RNA polymerase sigma factor (sigma-70 family)